MSREEVGIDREERRGRQESRERRVNYFDYSFLFVIIFLICFGFLMLYSASSYSAQLKYGDSTYFLRKQITASLLGVVAMLFCTFVDYRWWQKYINLIYFGSIVSIFLVLTPLGLEFNGARRWIGVGSASIQPAELVKMAVILTMAHMISQNSKHLKNWKVFLKILVYALIGAGLVAVVTSNLSSAIIIFGIAVVMLFVASPQYKIFVAVAIGAIVLVGGFIGIGLLSGEAGFRFSRIMVWLDPESYASEGGYQVLQGLYAIGSGKIFGKGLGQSVQKLGFIPEAQNDYIFTIICEELGVVGAVAVIMMFIFLIRRMVVIAGNAPDLFGSMVVVGVMAHISIQVILNIAVVTNSIPNTGVTLPFISYGGTSVLFLMSEVGLVLSVSRRIKRVR